MVVPSGACFVLLHVVALLSRCADSILQLLLWTAVVDVAIAGGIVLSVDALTAGKQLCRLVVVETGRLRVSMMRRCNFSMTGVFSRRGEHTGGGGVVVDVSDPRSSVGLALSPCGGGQPLRSAPQRWCRAWAVLRSAYDRRLKPWLIPDPVVPLQPLVRVHQHDEHLVCEAL
jgi:hypothetical protein